MRGAGGACAERRWRAAASPPPHLPSSRRRASGTGGPGMALRGQRTGAVGGSWWGCGVSMKRPGGCGASPCVVLGFTCPVFWLRASQLRAQLLSLWAQATAPQNCSSVALSSWVASDRITQFRCRLHIGRPQSS